MIDRNHLKYVHETLDPLIGATIVGCDLEAMGPHSIDAAPVLILSLPNGQRVHLSAWRDDEGNGGGALVVTKATKPAPKPAPKLRPMGVRCSVIGSSVPHSHEQCAVPTWFDCGCDKPLCSAHAKQTLAENAIYREPKFCRKQSCVVPAIVKIKVAC